MIAWIENVQKTDDDLFVKIRWSKEGVGFGELDVTADYEGNTTINTEFMGREFVREVFNELVNSATLVD